MLSEFFVVNIPPIPASDDFQIFVPADDYQPDEIVIFKIDLNYYFPSYDEESNNYIYTLPRNSGFVNLDANTIVTTILYNYNKEEILDARKGDVIFNQILDYEIVFTTSCLFTDSSLWRNGALVKSVEGPFQDDKKVEKIDLKKPVYYLAVPESNEVSDSQLLSIKWEYQYNEGEFNKFKNSSRSVVEDGGLKKCKIQCQFHNRIDIREVRMFAYFKSRSPKVSKKVLTTNAVENNNDFSNLIWSSKLSNEELQKIVEISKRLKCNPNHLIAAMALETGGTFNPAIVNSLGYTGLIQIGKTAAQDINRRKGTKITAGKNGNLKKMSRLEQLTIVEYYLEPFKGRLNTIGDFYLAILFPVDCGKGNLPNHVVFDKNIQLTYKNGKVVKNTAYYRKRAYAANPAFHLEKKEQGKTYVWEITKVIERWYTKGKSNKRSFSNTATTEPEVSNPVTPSDGSWHDPVDNPMCTIYMQSGGGGEAGKHWGLFGKTRHGGNHQGLDLFATTGTNIYACVDGTIYNRRWHGGYGNTVTIKVKDKAAFLARRLDYELQFKSRGEMKQGASWSEKGDIFLFYAHLHSVNEFNFGDEVASGQVLGTTGRSGVTGGTTAPHLHFEIFCSYTFVEHGKGVGTKYRINPAFFVDYKGYDEQSEDERKKQKTEKERGKLKQINGKVKLVYNHMPGFIR